MSGDFVAGGDFGGAFVRVVAAGGCCFASGSVCFRGASAGAVAAVFEAASAAPVPLDAHVVCCGRVPLVAVHGTSVFAGLYMLVISNGIVRFPNALAQYLLEPR